MSRSDGIIVRMVALVLPALFVESAVAGIPPAEAPSVRVHYDDLNLNAPQGVAGLYHRIRNAAEEVCKPAEGPQLVNRLFWREWNDCFYHAVDNAVHTVHNEQLSAYHAERIRGSKHPGFEATAIAARQ